MAADQLSVVFGALADPTRRAILAQLMQGEASVAELAAPFRVSQPAISKHLKVLERAGLITRERRATTRLSHLEATPLREASEWLATYRAWWEESHERLDELLARLQEGGPNGSHADQTEATGRDGAPAPHPAGWTAPRRSRQGRPRGDEDPGPRNAAGRRTP